MADNLKQQFYVSTPIYYPSNKLHIGNSYTTVLADYIARYHRLSGKDVFFLTGTDEHGQKIEKTAAEAGTEPQAFVDGIVAWIKELWEKMDISYDYFIRTTDEEHVRRVQAIFVKLYEQGDIYKGEYEGWYCTPCEAFWTETQLNEQLCPDCGRAVDKAKEECYFFRLSKYQPALLDLFARNADWLVPDNRVREMVSNFLEPGLQDLAVSRTSFKWGIPVPFDERHVIYVWLDALTNYITALGYQPGLTLPDSWSESLQLLGKDIVRFHAIIWPAFLMALDLPLPKQLYAHGWLTFKDDKMSKSKGNVIDPMFLCERYGVDSIRYFLLREMPYGGDGRFSNEALIERINVDLANDLGNLYSRTMAMSVKYFAGLLPPVAEREATAFDSALIAVLQENIAAYHQAIAANRHAESLGHIWQIISRANKYIDETCPWILAKDENKSGELANVLAKLLEILRQTAIALLPAMPGSMKHILTGLHQETDEASLIAAFAKLGQWSEFETVAPLAAASPLFPRLDLEKEVAFLNDLLAKQQAAAAKKAELAQGDVEACCKQLAASSSGSESCSENKSCSEQESGVVKGELSASANAPADVAANESEQALISFDDWLKLDLRIGEVIACEKVPKADKLLHETVKLADGEIREVVSGIAEHYQPEELIGKQVVLLCNLPERKLRGIVSQAMILTAVKDDGGVVLLQPEQVVDNGAKIA